MQNGGPYRESELTQVTEEAEGGLNPTVAYVLGGLQGTRTWVAVPGSGLFLGSGHVWSWVCMCDYVSMSSLFGWTLLGDWGKLGGPLPPPVELASGGGAAFTLKFEMAPNPVLHMTLSNPSTRKRGFLVWTRGTPG